ncbi:MAG: xanthine dehydrogenase family protein molybdopterin-binding subunit, partial [Alphaproteobacteria bacterium]|nr:xanthine dehydrogenase family protein molybdopterin-binding subunit [Alphaproteobacteria bacterium]
MADRTAPQRNDRFQLPARPEAGTGFVSLVSSHRVEDDALLRGRGQFVDDIAMPDALHVAFVRAAALGTLVPIDTGRASAMPGVALTITGAELRDLPALGVNPLVPGLRVPPVGLLAPGQASFVGQPMAAVVATSLDAARDAAETIDATARGDAIPAAIECFSQCWAHGDVDRGFADAVHIARVRVAHPRLAPMALEPRAALARWDETAGRLAVWLSTQTPHRARESLARILGLEETRVRVIAPDVGGAFGGKASIHPEEIVIAWAALRLKR